MAKEGVPNTTSDSLKGEVTSGFTAYFEAFWGICPCKIPIINILLQQQTLYFFTQKIKRILILLLTKLFNFVNFFASFLPSQLVVDNFFHPKISSKQPKKSLNIIQSQIFLSTFLIYFKVDISEMSQKESQVYYGLKVGQ